MLVPPLALYALAAIGAIKLAVFLFNLVCAIVPFGGTNPAKLGKWAVVTGASEGIGAAYCEELAAKGMNIVLISRSADKLAAAESSLKEKYPQVETKIVALDLGLLGDAGTRAELATVLDPLEIGVLVNNVGISYDYPACFNDLPTDRIEKLISLNVTATTYMTQLVLPKMAERKRGAIISISSAAGVMSAGSPMLAMYSGTKAFVERFTRSIAAEYPSLIVQTHTPYFVSSAMSKMRPSLMCPKPSGFVKASIKTLGCGGPNVIPYWAHGLQHFIVESAPASLVASQVLNMHKSIRKRALKKLDKAK